MDSIQLDKSLQGQSQFIKFKNKALNQQSLPCYSVSVPLKFAEELNRLEYVKGLKRYQQNKYKSMEGPYMLNYLNRKRNIQLTRQKIERQILEKINEIKRAEQVVFSPKYQQRISDFQTIENQRSHNKSRIKKYLQQQNVLLFSHLKSQSQIPQTSQKKIKLLNTNLMNKKNPKKQIKTQRKYVNLMKEQHSNHQISQLISDELI